MCPAATRLLSRHSLTLFSLVMRGPSPPGAVFALRLRLWRLTFQKGFQALRKSEFALSDARQRWCFPCLRSSVPSLVARAGIWARTRRTSRDRAESWRQRFVGFFPSLGFARQETVNLSENTPRPYSLAGYIRALRTRKTERLRYEKINPDPYAKRTARRVAATPAR
jgi:hypothetical protein